MGTKLQDAIEAAKRSSDEVNRLLYGEPEEKQRKGAKIKRNKRVRIKKPSKWKNLFAILTSNQWRNIQIFNKNHVDIPYNQADCTLMCAGCKRYVRPQDARTITLNIMQQEGEETTIQYTHQGELCYCLNCVPLESEKMAFGTGIKGFMRRMYNEIRK